MKRVRCLSGRCIHQNAKKGPEIDHEPNRDKPNSKKHGHLMETSHTFTIKSGVAWMCLKEQMTDLLWYYLYSGGCKGCILGTALSGIVTVPWHVNDTNEMLVVYT